MKSRDNNFNRRFRLIQRLAVAWFIFAAASTVAIVLLALKAFWKWA